MHGDATISVGVLFLPRAPGQPGAPLIWHTPGKRGLRGGEKRKVVVVARYAFDNDQPRSLRATGKGTHPVRGKRKPGIRDTVGETSC